MWEELNLNTARAANHLGLVPAQRDCDQNLPWQHTGSVIFVVTPRRNGMQQEQGEAVWETVISWSRRTQTVYTLCGDFSLNYVCFMVLRSLGFQLPTGVKHHWKSPPSLHGDSLSQGTEQGRTASFPINNCAF